ncbi:MAG: hypothetical protein ACRC2J_20875 [Microcoleaceae cyanobacterium]
MAAGISLNNWLNPNLLPIINLLYIKSNHLSKIDNKIFYSCLILGMNTNYESHLYFEKYPKSKEYALNKCINILAMIAVLKDRNLNITLACEAVYGKNNSGAVTGTVNDVQQHQKNKDLIILL